MTNASGVEIETTEYMPFGSQRNHSGTNTSAYKFTDQELDAENGLYNYNARLYDPIIGRFISLDTIVPDSYNPQSLNRYSYCLNNPLIYTDPSGHQQMPFEAYAQLIAMMNTLCALFPSSAGLLSGSGTCFLTGFEVQAVNTESMELAQFLDEARSSSGVGGGGTNPITSSNYDPNNSDPDYRNRSIHEAIKQSGYIGEFDLNSKDFKKK